MRGRRYKDASKTAFKSSTRLECMMQDFPKALPPGAKVGFTTINQVRCGVVCVEAEAEVGQVGVEDVAAARRQGGLHHHH